MTGRSRSAKDRFGVLSKDKAELLKLLLQREARHAQRIQPYPRVVRDGAARAPASWAQQRLWFIDQLQAASAAYNIAIAVRLQGPLNQDALQRALDEIVERHEVLRTVFVNVGGVPEQEITTGGQFALITRDLRDLAPIERLSQARALRVEEAHKPFDLRVGPLVRGQLLRLNGEEHLLLITMHHSISDGWSMGVFFRELTALYAAYEEGRVSPLEPLSIQYADYAQWQQQWLPADLKQKQLSYWKKQLAGAASYLELPTDRPRAPTQSGRGETLAVALDASLSSQLRAFAQRHEITLFMALHAGFAMLLARLSGQEDIIVGTPVANRRQPELEPLIGFFVNSLALRVAVAPESSVADLVKQVKSATLGAFDHQDVPFDQVVEALQPERSSNRNPLFQAMLALQTAPNGGLQARSLKAVVEEPVDEPSMFDLLLSLEERGEEIVGLINYPADLFDRQTIQRWMACFTVLLKAMTSSVHARIGDLPILPDGEHALVVECFNATQVEYPRSNVVPDLFEIQAARTPAAVAVMHERRALSYAELNSRANQLARYLTKKGVGPDRLVGVCFERSLDMIVALLGVLKAGGAYVPLDPNYPAERLQHMLSDAAPHIVLTEEKLKASLTVTAAEAVAFDLKRKELSSYSKENLSPKDVRLGSRSLVYVIYTSGSTGQPKGTAMSHQSMVNLIEWHRRTFEANEGKRVLQFAALSFDVAFQEIFTTLCTGGTLVLLDEWLRRDAREVRTLLQRERVQRLFVPPLMLQSLAESSADDAAPLALEDVITAGEQLRVTPEIVRFFKRLENARLHNHYGPTETHVVTALTLSDDPETWPTLPSIGRPLANCQIYILDTQRRPVPVGVPGEIFIGGAGVARGYLRRPEMTAQRFVSNPFAPSGGDSLYKTGDLGKWRADGTIEYLGRNDHQVKIRGFRIELGEIEAQLARHEQIKDVVVVAHEQSAGDKRLVAYFTARDQAPVQAEYLRAHLQAALPEYMVPSAFVMLEKMPQTPSGKIDRRALPAPGHESYVSRRSEPPQGETENQLAEIWQGLLRVERVGREDNFFELGGHSLHGTKLAARVAQRFAIHLPVIAVFQHPTIRQMAEKIELLRAEHAATIVVREERACRAPLTFSQLTHWHLYDLSKNKSVRAVTTATRIQGLLKPASLSDAFSEIVRRHEALRTRVILSDGMPIQEITDADGPALVIEDWSKIPDEQRDVQIQRRGEELSLQPIDVGSEWLISAYVLRFAESDHVLILSMEHMISDAYSMNLLLGELFTAYAQLRDGHPISLPLIDMQFSDYARWQRQNHESWLREHGGYWNERLKDCERLRFPYEKSTLSADAGWGTAPIAVSGEVKEQLREWCRRRRSTLVMGVFTAYVATVLRWCKTEDAVIQFQIDGRGDPRIDSTVGYFASILFLRIQADPDVRFSDLLSLVTQEYCSGYSHADASYLESGAARPDYARNTIFNWVPEGGGAYRSELVAARDAITLSPVRFSRALLKILERDNEPSLTLFDTEQGIVGGMHYPVCRFTEDVMQRFCQNLVRMLETMLKYPDLPVREVMLL